MNLSLNSGTKPDVKPGSAADQAVNLSLHEEPSDCMDSGWPASTGEPLNLSSPPVEKSIHWSQELSIDGRKQDRLHLPATEDRKRGARDVSAAAPLGLGVAVESGQWGIQSKVEMANFLRGVEAGLIAASTLEAMIQAGKISAVSTPNVVEAMQQFYKELHFRLTSGAVAKVGTRYRIDSGSGL